MNREEKITELFQSYLSEIDDFYEAKEAFMDDLNLVFFRHGDKGVICKEDLSNAYEHIRKFVE